MSDSRIPASLELDKTSALINDLMKDEPSREEELHLREVSKEIAADLKDGIAEENTLDTFRRLLTSDTRKDSISARMLARQATSELEKEHKLPGLEIVASPKQDSLTLIEPGLEATTWDLKSDRVKHIEPLEGELADLVPVLTDLIESKQLDPQSVLILAKHFKAAPDVASKAALWKEMFDRLAPYEASIFILEENNLILGQSRFGVPYGYDLNTGEPRDLRAEVKRSEEAKRAASPSWYERLKSYWK